MDSPLLWSLISVQIFMGGFDTIVHHEGSERLAWRTSQKTELRLHSIRNFFYAIIFLCFGWTEPHGFFTVALSFILFLEVLITLWDFVEEDLTRKLPWTERINHTLLALNYGAILALAAPVLWEWSLRSTAIYPANYGWWSVMATLAALGVGLFSARDLLAATRSERLERGNAAALAAGLPPRQHILVTGGTGFVGRRLVECLVVSGHYVTVLTRNLKGLDELAHPVRVITSLDQIHNADRLDAIVNLAGEPVANGLWTARKRARIVNSRVKTTKALQELIRRLDRKPACFVSGSAVGWYGLRGDELLTEDADPDPAFVHEVCDQWERSAAAIGQLNVRVVILRIGLVLGVEGGMLARLLTPFEFFGGGVMGTGRQWMSWIEHDDLIRVIVRAMSDTSLRGVVNATAPEPVRNVEFTQALAQALHRIALLHFPAWLLSGTLGDMGRETMLGGQRVVPAKLTRSGFRFRHPQMEPMLLAVAGARKPRPGSVGQDGRSPARSAP
ncbi:TIGR01777 family oxidoreductase [Roseibium porphyridii]|uniref:TIGR01777 family oxidoreductase n=1 Tax=Roseibium porphyridii TaxID=2866279 RepID=A0ABY8F2Y7_9HYPH|nr:TIGR01777 family oxidoreductase [Roseibium sp. KMA01]WFE89164.1 TIGR01777 family oxidoreductase [Roseibium sp. KMA01]